MHICTNPSVGLSIKIKINGFQVLKVAIYLAINFSQNTENNQIFALSKIFILKSCPKDRFSTILCADDVENIFAQA